MSIRTLSILAVIAALIAFMISVPGCGDTSSQSSTPSDDPRADWPDEIVFGLVPSEGGADIVERFEPLLEFLNERLDHPVVPKPASEYAGVITAMQNKQVELAYYGPKSYVEASRVANAEAIIKELNADGIAGYKGTIIVHVDSPAETLADTKGMTFAFVTPNSTSGYLVPALGILRETGVPAEEFYSEIRYTGSHGSSMNAVATGAVQAAATNTLDMNAMINAGQVDGSAMKVVWTSELIPSAPIAVRRDIPESLKTALREAFLAFNEHPDLLKQMSRGGFVTADDGEYDSVRMLEQKQHDIANAGPKTASDG
jgi:phosphonate transport system substrate-binding protein